MVYNGVPENCSLGYTLLLFSTVTNGIPEKLIPLYA
jgi:hypothetical protein